MTEASTDRPHYAGAVYGSMLAASVVVGAGAGGHFDLTPGRLALLLVATGLVFWFAHAYALFVGDRVHHATIDRRELRHVARQEWPLVQAAVPPAVAALLAGLLGAGNETAGWVALLVALAQQVGWATFATIRAGAGRLLILGSAVVNLVLGGLIVVLKTALVH